MDLTQFMTLGDFEDAARATLDQASWAYLAGGAGAERTIAANMSAYQDVWFTPRVLNAVPAPPDLGTSVFGQPLSLPVILAPTSPQRLLHEEAELATARAAHRAGTIAVTSADGHFPFPATAEAGPGACWFQVYPYRSLDDVDEMVAMAEKAGATALVITVDAYHRPRRISTRRARFSVPDYVDFGSLRLLGILDGTMPSDARLDRIPLSWADVERIRARTTIPLVIKGVIRPEDAERCVEAGADGIIVSNHGGRQLDGVMPSLPALAGVAERVGDRCTVLMDGGVRSGGDVVKALALGARAVCIGRPYLWGLRLAGENGIAAVLDVLRQEIEDVLLELGLPGVAALSPDSITAAGAATTGLMPRKESLT